MADKFEYDPEGENEGAAKTRLPFGICKAHGIKIEDWWTPRDAWEALKGHGIVKEVSEEYKEYYRSLKRERAKASRERSKKRAKAIKKQETMPEHTADPTYEHQTGAISGATKGSPMSFAEADGSNCNPYYNKGLIGYATNCQTCVAAYIARRQGYDVRALPNLNNEYIYRLSYNTSLAYVDGTGNHPKMTDKPRGVSTVSWLEQNIKDGETYAIEGNWKGRRSGHIICVERENGELRVYDPQTSKIYSPQEAQSKYFGLWKDIKMMNLTNVSLDESFCDHVMKKG